MNIDGKQVNFSLSYRGGKANVNMTNVSFLTPAAKTNWPMIGPDGNLSTKYGPTDPMNAKYIIDICSTPVSRSDTFSAYKSLMDTIDDKLLDFFLLHQTALLGRKNLTKAELKLLQVPSVKEKYDKSNGDFLYYAQTFSTKINSKGTTRTINVFDNNGKLTNDSVNSGDVISAAVSSNMVYIMGDKFGIHWTFSDVCIIAKAESMRSTQAQAAFANFLTSCDNAVEAGCGA